MLFTKNQVTALAAMLAHAQAHVKIETPVPYGAGNGAPALDTNPLLADGSDFPCKQRPDVYKVVKQNFMAIGEPQILSFQGQATHGGGSCQISLSTDKFPTKSSVWKVIMSYEGGCPSKNPGNVGESPFGFGADKFTYKIPPEISAGDYTLAWTWFNKIGDREMYMNCAPITVTESHPSARDLDNSTLVDEGLSKRGMDSLPDMFVANIGNGCTTAASPSDLEIPAANLGKYTQRINTGPLTPPTGSCSGSAGGNGAGQAVPVSPQASPAAQQPSTPAAQPQASTPVAQPQPDIPAAQPSTSAAQPQPTPQSPDPVPAGLQTGTCPTPGKSICSPDGGSIGTCDENHQVIFQKVPVGTKCDPALGVEVHARRGRIVRKLGVREAIA